VRHSGWEGVPWADVLFFFTFTQQFGFFVTVSVIACAVATSYSFVEDFESKYSNFVIARSSKDEYVVAKFLAVSISGGLLLAFSMLLYIVLLRIEFPLIAEDSLAIQNYMAMNSDSAFLTEVLGNGNYITYFAVYILLAFLFGALWSTVGVAISTFILNKFISAFTPYILLYLNTLFLSGTDFRAETVFRANYSFGSFDASLIFGIGYFVIQILVCGILFRNGAMRRIKN
jgi:hypothetical protein